MFKELREKLFLGTAVSGVFTMGIGNFQLHELSNDIKKLNDTMIVIVQKQDFSEREIDELKEDIKDLKKFRLEVLKNAVKE